MRCWADQEPPPAFPWAVFLAGFFTCAGLVGAGVLVVWANGGW
jgi:hypothetical protein